MNPNSAGEARRTALVVGGTGAIGSELLQALLASDRYERILCLGRRLPQIEHARIVGRVVDFEQLEEFSPVERIDDVFCALGTTLKAAGSADAFKRVDFDTVLKMGALAQRLNAQTLSVVSSIGADAAASSLYLQTKGAMEAALIALELPALHIFRPSLLAGSLKRQDFRLQEVLANGALALLGPLLLHGRWRKYRRIAPARVARAMVQAVLDGRLGTVIYESDVIAELTDSPSNPLG
jgi:uncharacterized protein YbjT (DUF2867 family)